MEVGCVGVVFESSGGGFVVVVLEDFGVVLRMAFWCWNERGDFLRRFSLMSVVGNMYIVAGTFLFGYGDLIWVLLGRFGSCGVDGAGEGVDVVELV